VLPNFLIIGAARSGTTSLYSALRTHPDVYLPRHKRPEPHFFLKQAEFTNGLGYYEDRYFADWNGQHAVGEASTSYLLGEKVPARVADALPEVKLICVLRNPIDRAFSGYWHTVASGLETLPFDQALAEEASRRRELAGTPLGEIAPFAYVERGLYHEQLVRWLEVFPRSRIQIILFEDLVGDSQRVLHGLAGFLGIPAGGFGRSDLFKENPSVPDGAQLSAAQRLSLAERFRTDVTALGTLLHRDLRHWLETHQTARLDR
jgi:hypothetical protein